MSHIGPAIDCSPSAIATPAVFGAEILSLEASWVNSFTFDVPADFNYNHGALHRRRRIAGQQFVLSQFFMGGAIGEGYATTITDAGLGDTMPDAWPLKRPGNVNLEYLHSLGYRSLNDEAIIAKGLVRSFYGIPPVYSYWSGCSHGGRQGLMFAQRYPHAYNGIATSAPAQSWPEISSPLSCKLEFLTEEVVKHCDPKDGIVDGIISDPENCHFEPFTAVNQTFSCSVTGKPTQLRRAAAIMAESALSDPRSVAGDFLWYGANPGSDISSLGVAPGQNIKASPDEWLSLFVPKNQSFDVTRLSHEEYDTLFRLAVKEYTDVMAANDPDLTTFKKAGGKLLTYHGMADQSIQLKIWGQS
ncbi:putative feruloyl esterase [Aspergillus novofumigatus IBT 16806]|uniref:Carboxylic ester hydrolase n=1 Tax=Aspergillus novofumigatus (strain IBT 16806) TaxID=1392255 RepID=A0A2I1CFI8_ASPN1|nr:tannase-domain-containing protein [Aspergillus novofumigatus IBT 16806]PKX96360.1 tannase-domain-containing protein [Aspergillus novofumigatus IBT 16806]